MGWLFCADSRRVLIQHLTKTEDRETIKFETLAHCTKGYGLLWTVNRTTNKQTGYSVTFIVCNLLMKSEGLWGYKDVEECMSPYQYSCPLSYLAMAPVTCETWRDGVRNYHQVRKERREKIKALKARIKAHNTLCASLQPFKG